MENRNLYILFCVSIYMDKMKCVVCGREKRFGGEGRIIDGSWADDINIDYKYFGKWVCCYNCYSKLLKK